MAGGEHTRGDRGVNNKHTWRHGREHTWRDGSTHEEAGKISDDGLSKMCRRICM